MRLADLDRQPDKVNVVVLAARVFRAHTPNTVLAGAGRHHAATAVLFLVNHLKPRSGVVVRSEHHPLPEMRLQMRPRHLPGRRFELDRNPLARLGRFVLGIVDRALLLGQSGRPFPTPIQHCRVIGLDLSLLVVLVAGLALRRQLHLDPVFDRHDGRIALPVRLPLLHNLEGLAEPIEGLADKLV